MSRPIKQRHWDDLKADICFRHKTISPLPFDERYAIRLFLFLKVPSWPCSMLVSRPTNLQKCTTRLRLSTAYFFLVAKVTFAHSNIEHGLSDFKFYVPVVQVLKLPKVRSFAHELG